MNASPTPFDFGSLFDDGGVLLAGGTLRGWPVSELVIRTTDGRQQTIQLPPPFQAAGEESAAAIALTNYQRKIVAHFSRLPQGTRLRGHQIASDLKESSDTLRKHLAGLVATDVLDNPKDKEGYGRGPNFDAALENMDVP